MAKDGGTYSELGETFLWTSVVQHGEKMAQPALGAGAS